MINRAGNKSNEGGTTWWLHPVTTFVGLNTLTGIGAFLASQGTYLDLWRTPKYFGGSTMLLMVAMMTAFSVGAWLVLANRSGRSSESEWSATVSLSQTLLLFNISFWVCITGYIIWAAFAVSRGVGLALLKSAFTGGAIDIVTLKTDFLETVSGVTTLTQLGIAAVVLGCVIGAGVGWRIVRQKLTILFLLALVRALLFSERLAILELAVPFIVCLLADSTSRKPSRMLRTMTRIAPALGVAAVFILFIGFEYDRSWSNYYSSTESSLLLFGFWRLLGYYLTSINNSAYLLSRFPHSLGAPYFSFNFLWRFPGLNVLVKDVFSWVHLDYNRYMDILTFGANPEFNNWGGLLSPVLDFGVAGALAYWTVMGLVTGYLYRLFVRKHPLGLFIYPIVYLTLTEVPRYLYWGSGRAFLPLAYLLLSAALLLRTATLYHPSNAV